MRNIYYFFGLLVILTVSCKSGNQQDTSADSVHDTTESYQESQYHQDNSGVSSVCPELVKEILRTSPRYRKLTEGMLVAVKKNGGSSVDIYLSKSPDPKQDNTLDYSEYYELEVSENYPDRRVNIAHFSFDPQKMQLYEYDVVRNQLITIDFNRDLLLERTKYCKE